MPTSAPRVPDPDTPSGSCRVRQRRQLQLALDALPPEQREGAVAAARAELSLEEIGAVTGWAARRKSRLRYAMDKLRARFRPEVAS